MIALTARAADHLVRYDWPGNVRELENAVERAVVLASGSRLEDEDFPEEIGAAALGVSFAHFAIAAGATPSADCHRPLTWRWSPCAIHRRHFPPPNAARRSSVGAQRPMSRIGMWESSRAPRASPPPRGGARRLAALASVLVLGAPGLARAAATLDALSTAAAARFTNNLSFNHSVGGGAGLLVVAVIDGNLGTTATSVSYGGAPLRRVDIAQGQDIASELWRLDAPAPGTAPVVITLSSANDRPFAAALSFTGVDRAAALGPASGRTGMGAAISVAVATEPGDLVVDAAAGWMARASPTVTAGAGQTTLWSMQYTRDTVVMGSRTPATGTTTGMSWTLSAQLAWATLAVAVKGAPAADAAAPDVGAPPEAGAPPPDAPMTADAPVPQASDAAITPDAIDGAAPPALPTADGGAPRSTDAHAATTLKLRVGTACAVGGGGDTWSIVFALIVAGARVRRTHRDRRRRAPLAPRTSRSRHTGREAR